MIEEKNTFGNLLARWQGHIGGAAMAWVVMPLFFVGHSQATLSKEGRRLDLGRIEGHDTYTETGRLVIGPRGRTAKLRTEKGKFDVRCSLTEAARTECLYALKRKDMLPSRATIEFVRGAQNESFVLEIRDYTGKVVLPKAQQIEAFRQDVRAVKRESQEDQMWPSVVLAITISPISYLSGWATFRRTPKKSDRESSSNRD